MINDLLKYTGNPFVDAGIFALKRILNKQITEISVNDLNKEVENIANLYTTEKWKKDMHTIFPNSILVNPASTNKDNLEELYLDRLKDLIEIIPEVEESGSCMSCGRREAKNTFKKDYIPLTGSNALKNYFSFANDGADYCSLCALLIQFSPLLMYRSGDRMILLHSNSEKVMNYWAKQSIKNINSQIAIGEFTGCFNEGYGNPNNAIFRIISKIISANDLWEGENPSLNFYYFTNYNQEPKLEIFTVPTNVFNFLTYIPPDEKRNWDLIVRNAYHVNWDKVETIDDYKNKKNEVYNNLLKNNSILRFFYNSKFKKVYCSWNLVKYYLREVKYMDEKRISVIKDVGDKLANYIKNNDDKKVLSNLETSSNYNTFRNVLRKVFKSKITNEDEELLFTFDDYVINLFPEGNRTWKETQDLLLFRIYEQLHNWMVESKYVEEYNDKTLEEDE